MTDLHKLVIEKFTSGNSIGVERITITRKEYEAALAQPEREWVGLTIEEIKEMLYGLHGDDRTPMLTLVNVVEAKLKEKNAEPTAQTGNT